MTNKINTGVWLDFKGAYLVTIDADGQASVQYLVSDVKHPASKGGTRSKTPWGPQFSPGDKNNLEREKHAERHYYENILENIRPDTDNIVIFGPAEAKIGLKKSIEEIKNYKPMLRGVIAADHLSQNEIVALVREFFKNLAD